MGKRGMKRRANGVVPNENRSLVSCSGANYEEILSCAGSGGKGDACSAGKDVDDGTAEKEKGRQERKNIVVVSNKRLLRSDIKYREGVVVENGVIQFFSDKEKSIGGNGVLLSPEGTLAPSDVKIADDLDVLVTVEDSGINIVNNIVNGEEEEVQTDKKRCVSHENTRVLRSHLKRKEGIDDKDVVQFQFQGKKTFGKPVDVLFPRERTKCAPDVEVFPVTDDWKFSKDKCLKEKKMDHAEQGTETLMKKMVLSFDVIQHEEANGTEELSQPQPERKSVESLDAGAHVEGMKTPSDAEVPLKKIKTDSFGFQEGNSKGNKMNKAPNDTLMQADPEETIMHVSVCLEAVTNTGSENNGVAEKQNSIISDKNGKKHDDNIKSIEQSGTRALRMLRNRNFNPAGSQRADSSVLPKTDRVMRANGIKYISNALPQKKLKAACGTPKQSPISPGREVHEKSISGAVMAHSHSKRSIRLPNRKNIIKEQKSEPVNISAAGVPWKKKLADTTAGKGSKSLLSNKKKVYDCSRSLAMQSLRDQIKGILLNAGWKIDLRPRSGKNYLDSVYIPPNGRGGLWSITKAYNVYQETLKSAGAEKSIGTANMPFEADSIVEEGSTSSLSAITLQSLSILKKKMVNKRRSRVEMEQAMKCKKSKGKDISHKTSPKRHRKMKDNRIRRKKSADILGSHACASVSFSVRKNVQSRRNKHLLARGSNQEAECESKDFVPYAGKRTLLSWMIDLGVVPLNGKVKYSNDGETEVKLEGLIKRDGIQCGCCNKIVPISDFEHHAASKLLPASENIHVESLGVSLMQCQLDAWEKQDVSERQEFFEIDITGEDCSDDTCGICGDGGDLICCDSCPSVFHLSCLGIEMLPSGDWNCTNCSCQFCREVTTCDVLERVEATPLLSCSQCEQKYHQSCVSEADAVNTNENDSDSPFCGQSCKKIFMQLNRLIGTKNDLEGGFSWSLIRRFDDGSSSLHSIAKRAECNSKIAVAFAVMDECFLPITDKRSGIDLIHNVVYNCGSNFSRLNYTGFYTFVLERGDEIISAASVRFHGMRLAEMPFIGTRNMYRRQGMARQLLNGIETLLCSLNVEKLVIPAISEMWDTWTSSFGFTSPKSSEEIEFRSVNLLVFPGVGLLLKRMLESNSAVPQKLAEAKLVDRNNQNGRIGFSNESPNAPSIVPNLNASIRFFSDDLVDSGANVCPKSVDDPNKFEASMPDHKSSEVIDDDCVNIPPAAVNVDLQPVTVSSRGTDCQLLYDGKGKLNNGLRNVENWQNVEPSHISPDIGGNV